MQPRAGRASHGTRARLSNATCTLYHSLSFDFIRDLAPVAYISQTPAVLVVNPSLPAGTVPEFIAYAKANPGKINMASGGIGTLPFVAAELFKAMTGVDFVHAPYSTAKWGRVIRAAGIKAQ